MAHDINFSNGRYAFASKQEVAWHGLGQVVETLTSKEAIELGGLDFTVEKRPIYIHGSHKLSSPEALSKVEVAKTYDSNLNKIEYRDNILIKNQYATIRTDTDIPLGVVGERYEVVQNIEAFDFMDSIIGKGVSYETVGALGNGEVVFLTVKVKEEFVVNKDLIDRYLLLTMSHDGTSAIHIIYTPIRVVCNNTLTAAIRGARNKVSIIHSKNARNKMEKAKQLLGITDMNSILYKECFEGLYDKPVSDSDALNVIIASLGIKPAKDSDLDREKIRSVKNLTDVNMNFSTKGSNIITDAYTYYFEGFGQEEIVGNAYGVFNGIAGFLQNVKEYRSEESKFKGIFLAGDTIVRDRALSLLV